MSSIIRDMTRRDRAEVIAMMRSFYASDAVLSNGSEKVFESDIENCVNESPYLEGYVFECGGEIAGYAMVAKSFSTEFGKRCFWIEDLYVKEKHRGDGIGGGFLDFIEKKYPDSVLRLEAESNNERALGVYKTHGYEVLPYLELIKKNKCIE